MLFQIKRGVRSIEALAGLGEECLVVMTNRGVLQLSHSSTPAFACESQFLLRRLLRLLHEREYGNNAFADQVAIEGPADP